MLSSVQIVDQNALSKVLGCFSYLDDIRWSQKDNYNLINYFKKGEGLTADEKLLTHWLCYITDRQMPFMRIWDLGGYVISHLVHSFKEKRDLDVQRIIDNYTETTWAKKKLKIKLKAPKERRNKRLQKYGIGDGGGDVYFASRYMPEDLLLIFRTLAILNLPSDQSSASDRSFAGYLIGAIRDLDQNDNGYHAKAISIMADALNKLTYQAAGNVKAERYKLKRRSMAAEIKKFRPDFKKARGFYNRKRLWCSLRDYLKSPEFNKDFVGALQEEGYPHSNLWKRSNQRLKKALYVLELPGDVWNNSEIFRDGLFTPFLKDVPETWKMPKTVRAIYNSMSDEAKGSFYPEQLDVTFDFVPRMCERSLCDVCLFGKGIKNLCHEKKGTYCSVVLVACGYKYECNPASCLLKSDSRKNLCRSGR